MNCQLPNQFYIMDTSNEKKSQGHENHLLNKDFMQIGYQSSQNFYIPEPIQQQSFKAYRELMRKNLGSPP